MKKVTWIGALALALAAFLAAQTSAGTFSGKITSANGNVVPNAAVTLTNTQTNTTQRVLSGPDGTFTFSNLAPGTYSMQVEIAGFKRAAKQHIELNAAGGAITNVTLEAGPTSEIVEIKGTSPAVQTQDAEISSGFGTRLVRELPVVDRNHQEIVGLQQGTTPAQPALDLVRDPERNRYFSTNGQPPTVNEWRMDGVTNLEPFRGSAVRVQPSENVQELMVESSVMPVNRGYSGGAIVTDMSRAGTNGWHGSLFEFYSGDILRTRNPFNAGGNPDPRFVHNQAGAAFGGPIARDKTFFFGSYEGTFDNGGMTQFATVPTAQAITGNFSAIPGLTVYNPNTGLNGANRTPFTGGIIPSAQINQTARAFARYFPAPNLAGFTNNYITNTPFRNNDNKADGRIDHHISDRTHVFLRYGYSNDRAYEGSVLGPVIGSSTRDRLLAQNAVIDLSHEFGPRLITDFRVGYNRYDQKVNSAGNNGPLAGALGLSNFNNLIGVNISGFGSLGAPAWVPEHAVDNNFDFVWAWQLHTSMHNVKAGVDIRRFRTDGFTDTMFGSTFGPSGTAFFGPGATMSTNGAAFSQYGFYNAFASFLAGAPSQVGISNYVTTPTIRQSQYAIWAGDAIQIMHAVTLDFGVRYEVYSPLTPRNAGGAAFYNSGNNTFNFAGIGNTGWHTRYDLDSIAPRIGLAVQVTKKTALRAGYAMNYFQQPYMLSGFMAPTYGTVSGVQGGFTTAGGGTFGPSFNNAPAAPNSLVNGSAAGNQTATVSPLRVDTPYVQNFNLQIQQEFVAGTVLGVGYVGAMGRHLPYVQELNAARPGAGVAGLPFASIGRTGSTLLFDNGVTNNYNSLQATLSKRFEKGLSFSASYTWSKALGYTSSNGTLLNPFDLRANYGPLDYDRQHVLSVGHLWELPFGRNGSSLASTILGGWQINGMFTWDSGTPLTITADPVLCACPGNAVLASLNGNPYAGGGANWLNPSAFSAPGAGQFSNLGRGAIRASGSRTYNLSLFKHFRVRERFNLELRGEAYNVTNSPHFAAPVTNINSPDFGRSVSTINGSFGRQVNLGVRALF